MAKKSEKQPDAHPQPAFTNDNPDLEDALRSIEAIGEDSTGDEAEAQK
jgi:hypothetical protein